MAATAPFGLLLVPALNKDSTIQELLFANEPVSQVNVVKKGNLKHTLKLI